MDEERRNRKDGSNKGKTYVNDKENRLQPTPEQNPDYFPEDDKEQQLDVFNKKCLREIFGSSWRDHMKNEHLIQRDGTVNLQYTVAVRRTEDSLDIYCAS